MCFECYSGLYQIHILLLKNWRLLFLLGSGFQWQDYKKIMYQKYKFYKKPYASVGDSSNFSSHRRLGDVSLKEGIHSNRFSSDFLDDIRLLANLGMADFRARVESEITRRKGFLFSTYRPKLVVEEEGDCWAHRASRGVISSFWLADSGSVQFCKKLTMPRGGFSESLEGPTRRRFTGDCCAKPACAPRFLFCEMLAFG